MLMQSSASWAHYTTPNLMEPPGISLTSVLRYQRWGACPVVRAHDAFGGPISPNLAPASPDQAGSGRTVDTLTELVSVPKSYLRHMIGL